MPQHTLSCALGAQVVAAMCVPACEQDEQLGSSGRRPGRPAAAAKRAACLDPSYWAAAAAGRRFFHDQIHEKEVLIEKLTLKNSTYKASIAKLEAQLAHKEEMGEVRRVGVHAAGLMLCYHTCTVGVQLERPSAELGMAGAQ